VQAYKHTIVAFPVTADFL